MIVTIEGTDTDYKNIYNLNYSTSSKHLRIYIVRGGKSVSGKADPVQTTLSVENIIQKHK